MTGDDIESSSVKTVLMGSAVDNFPVLYDKLDHIIMAAKLIDKMFPSATKKTF